MTRRNPLVDPLTEEAKAALSVIFARMSAQLCHYNPDRQRFLNKTWNLYR